MQTMTHYLQEAMKASGLTQQQIQDLSSMMVLYLEEGAKYGESPSGFVRWYMGDKKLPFPPVDPSSTNE